jgi:predicted metal-dependent hydrolase
MVTERHELHVRDLRVEVVRKAIKNLHLGVYPPNGRVRVAAPLAVSDEAVRLAVIGRLAWIRRQQARFHAQPRHSRREMVSGESHWFMGRRYRLILTEQDGRPAVALRGNAYLEMRVPPGSTAEEREEVLHRWYRARLRVLIPPLVQKWQLVLGVEASGWGIRRMKTRWGSCNPDAGRVWLNLELAKKPPACLEYILVHELTHLLARRHDEHFVAVMDRHLPAWRMHREVLNRAPLAHEDWTY